MIICRGFILLVIEQLLQRSLLIRAALQKKQHAVQRLAIAYRALIKFSASERVHVSSKHREISFVHSLRDTSRGA